MSFFDCSANHLIPQKLETPVSCVPSSENPNPAIAQFWSPSLPKLNENSFRFVDRSEAGNGAILRPGKKHSPFLIDGQGSDAPYRFL